ncbi:MAG: deoxyribodipyrimidine photo-lyase [Campylobacterales bacterium]|nr:deoxyribodipyrimidine photo-lyase [Campylobacterales bacterium]
MRRILWFRRDLRVEDNPLLSLGEEVLPIFIFDTNILDKLEKEDRRVSFIFHYVCKLKQDLSAYGLDLKIFYAAPRDVFEYLIPQGMDEVAACGDYDSYAKERDLQISHKIHFRYIHDTYIFKPYEVLKEDKTPYLVFTPFYKKARVILDSKKSEELKMSHNRLMDEDYEAITKIDAKGVVTKLPLSLESLGFLKQELGIINPHAKLEKFKQNCNIYKQMRDFLDEDVGSSLSVDLRFGTLSTRAILRYVLSLKGLDVEPFIRQLIFRDFYAYLLFHMPRVEDKNYKYSFNGIEDREKYEIFCRGQTGVPIVDAGVRELIQTGQMHNRMRMVAASFFTKDLLLPWQWGEQFFAQHLLDFDKATNVLSWQWSAGTGVDPQPYFRVFNPYLQSKKFDKDAHYIKRFCPELLHVEAKCLHDENYLLNNSVKDYPKPIVNHKTASKIAIECFKKDTFP